MTGEELLRNMDLIDPKLVKEANLSSARQASAWLKIGILAATAAVLAAVFLWKPGAGTVTDVGGITRNYKTIPIAQAETAPVYPWEYMTEIERYTGMTLDGTQYRTRARTMGSHLIGESIGTCFFTAYDIYTDKHYTLEKTAYEIPGISPSELVAVELGGEYCVFLKDTYAPPSDFGAFWDSIDLSDHAALENFILFSGENADNRQTSHQLENDALLWQMLADCRDAPYLELERFYDPSVETVSFSVTSDKLGVYKHGFQISSDGYISTNLMEWGYVFQIGNTAARKIIDYLKENSTPAPTKSYYHFLYGTYIGREEGYLLVDDRVLCVNEKEGMVFRIPADDIRISRVADLGYVSIGDVVLVNFTGEIDTLSGNVVSNPVSVQKGILWEDHILIEE